MWKYLKVFLILVIIISLILIIMIYIWKRERQKEEEKINKVEVIKTNQWEEILSQEERVEQFKRRLNFRSVIRKWDFYSIKNMKETALQYYLNAYKRLKNDHVLAKKIGDTYFEMKKFQNAYYYYLKIPSWELNEKEKEKMLKALLYTWNKNLRNEFNKINLPQDKKDYYDNLLVCYTWIKNCIESIKKYNWKSTELLEIKKGMLDFEKIGHTDPNSRYAILAWDFMKNKDYLAAIIIWEETLTKRPNYSSVLQLTWYAYYELGDYENANLKLQKYYQLEPKNVTVTYLLWIINFYTENYIASNLYLNAAVLNGYEPKNELQKRLAYNYYIIWDKKNMLKVFRYILDEKDATPDDYAVALFTAIEEKEYSKAMLRANKWIIKFEKSDMLYAFRWWIYRLRNELANSVDDLQISLRINPRNAVALYNMWEIEYSKWNLEIAKNYYKNTIEVDNNWTFWEIAKENIKKIDKTLKEKMWSWSIN